MVKAKKTRKVRGRNLFWLNREKESSIPARFGMKTEKVYLVHAYAGSRAGLKSVITICELNKEATKAITPSRIIFDGQ